MPDVRLLLDESLRGELASAGLLSLDAIFARDDMQVVKARLTERQTFRCESPTGCVFYVKRYVDPEPESFWAGLFARSFSSPAEREWSVLRRLTRIGVPAPQPAACIEEREGKRVLRAALVTVGLPAEISLQRVIREQTLPPARRQRLARELGRLLRAMHEGGVNHRDFYLVHIRVGADDKLYVTDLNRADIRRRVTRRWRIKDVGALLHSAAQATATDKARFAREYFGGRLRDHRDMIEAAIRKAARITARTAKRVAEGEANYHVIE
jgi:tRNA A-37 threonylcarbamoyl transferase component Bud32